MLVLDAYNGYQVQLVKEEEKSPTLVSLKIHLNLFLG